MEEGNRRSPLLPRAPRGALFGVVAAAAVLVGTGCMRTDVEVSVDPDGGGTVVVEAFPDRPTTETMQSLDLVAQVDALDDHDGISVERTEFSGNPGFRVTATAETDAELRDTLVEGVEVAGRRYSLFSELSVESSDDGEEWSLRAVPTSIGVELESAAIRGDAQLAEALAHPNNSPVDARLRVTVTLPGEVVDSNASTVSGGSATWNLHTANAPAELTMRSEVDEFPWMIVAAVAGGLVVVLVLAAQLGRIARNRRMRAGTPVTVGAGHWEDTVPAGTVVTRTAAAPGEAPPPPVPEADDAPPLPGLSDFDPANGHPLDGDPGGGDRGHGDQPPDRER